MSIVLFMNSLTISVFLASIVTCSYCDLLYLCGVTFHLQPSVVHVQRQLVSNLSKSNLTAMILSLQILGSLYLDEEWGEKVGKCFFEIKYGIPLSKIYPS